MVEYKVEVIICDAKQETSKTSTPYRTEAAARTAYKSRNLAVIAKNLKRVTFVGKRLVRIHPDQTEQLLESDAYGKNPRISEKF